MKKLLFLLLLALFIQCKNEEAKEKCGIVTEMVTIPSDTKAKPKTVPVSYVNCDYVVIMPQGTDNLVATKYLEENNFKLVKVLVKNPSIQLFTRTGPVGDGDGGTPVVGPTVPPKPIIIFKDTYGLDSQRQPVKLSETFSQESFNPGM